MSDAEVRFEPIRAKEPLGSGVLVRGQPVPDDFTADRERFCRALTNEAYLELAAAFGWLGGSSASRASVIIWDRLCACRDLLAQNGCEFPSYT